MPELKYAKYIITEDLARTPPAGFLKRREEQRKSGNYLEATHMLSLNDSIAKGALYCDTIWLWNKHTIWLKVNSLWRNPLTPITSADSPQPLLSRFPL
jgi:hypothetical protein